MILWKSSPGRPVFSARNLWNIKRFYEEYKDEPKLQQAVAEIPWGQNLLIMEKVADFAARRYYIHATAEMGWSRNVLLNQIKANAYERHRLASKQHNFEQALPVHLAEQADKSMKGDCHHESKRTVHFVLSHRLPYISIFKIIICIFHR